MPSKKILQYLTKQGEQLDTEIADAIGISVAQTRNYLSELTEKGEVMSCHTIRFVKGKKTEGISCRISGFIPKAAPGRKSKVQLKLS
jgi:DeoR/GlpR family transcriptional regulator of sugar metabolism